MKINGRIIDKYLFEIIIKRIKSEYPSTEINDILKNKIKKEVIEKKCKLSSVGCKEIPLNIDINGTDTFDGSLSIRDIKKVICDNNLNNYLTCLIESVINESGVKEEDLKKIKILPIGGSSRIPIIQSLVVDKVKERINVDDVQILRNINMDECICRGCCYFSKIIYGKYLFEVTYPSYGYKYTVKMNNGDVNEKINASELMKYKNEDSDSDYETRECDEDRFEENDEDSFSTVDFLSNRSSDVSDNEVDIEYEKDVDYLFDSIDESKIFFNNKRKLQDENEGNDSDFYTSEIENRRPKSLDVGKLIKKVLGDELVNEFEYPINSLKEDNTYYPLLINYSEIESRKTIIIKMYILIL